MRKGEVEMNSPKNHRFHLTLVRGRVLTYPDAVIRSHASILDVHLFLLNGRRHLLRPVPSGFLS